MTKKSAWLLLMLLLVPAASRAQQTRLAVTAARTRLFVGERLELSVVLQGPGVKYTGPFQVPDLMPYLELLDVRGPSTSHNFQFINGRMQSSGSWRRIQGNARPTEF